MAARIDFLRAENFTYEVFCELLERYELLEKLRSARYVAIKPNLCAGGIFTSESGVVSNKDTLRKTCMFIRNVNPECRLAIVESDSIGYGYAYKKFVKQGYGELENELGVETVDLTRTRQVMREVPKPQYFTRGIWLSEDLFQVDFLVSLAKIKTHNMTTMSCCLKNFFGCLSTPEKWVYHPKIAAVIADIHQVLKADLWLCEGLPALEGNGPVMGTPKELGIMVAANNPVACDAFVATLIGFRPTQVKHLVQAASCGVGDMDADQTDIRGYSGEKYRLKYVTAEQLSLMKLGLFIQGIGQRLASFGHLLHQQRSVTQIGRGAVKRLRRR